MKLADRIGGMVRKTFFLIFILAVAPVVLLVLLGIGGPYVFLMFFALYFVIGPAMQVCVRLHRQPARENRPTPWSQYWAMAFTNVLRAGAVIALCRLLLYVFLLVVAKQGKPEGSENGFLSPHIWDWFLGGCGLLFAFLAFAQEGLWLYRQRLAVQDLPTSTVASAAVGLVELFGTVRRVENRHGPLDPDRPVLSFRWKLLGTQQVGDTTLLGSYDKTMTAFLLDDGTGRILVDPVHNDVELRRPLISVTTTFFGRRSFEILLSKRTQRPSWYERRYALHEGDRAYVIGYAEALPGAPSEAQGPKRLVVRPRAEARVGYEALLQFLIPGGAPSRTAHDIFIVADTPEAETKQLLRRNFLTGSSLALLLAVLSALLIIITRSII